MNFTMKGSSMTDNAYLHPFDSKDALELVPFPNGGWVVRSSAEIRNSRPACLGAFSSADEMLLSLYRALCSTKQAEQLTPRSTANLALLRAAHAEWSQAQFGNVSAVGPAKHLAKEALEVAADPTNHVEHADCWMLLWDMQRRAGITDQQLADAIEHKLRINIARKWSAPKEGEAREHDRSEEADQHHG